MFAEIAAAMSTAALADTGTGGLFNASAPLLRGWHTMQAPQQNFTLPYAVVFHVSDADEKVFQTTTWATVYLIQISVWTDKANGLIPGGAATSRIRTVFDRWAPTITGYTPSQFMRQSGNILTEDRAYHHIEEYRITLAKS